MRLRKKRIAAVLGLALILSSATGSYAWKRGDLSETEKVLRGWLWKRTAKTTVRLATQPDLARPIEVYRSSGSVTLYLINTDVDRFGQVTYEGRTLFGSKVKVEPYQIPMDARQGSEVEILGFALKDGRINIQLKNPRGAERSTIRLFLGAGFQNRMDAGEMIVAISKVLDFGPDAQRFAALQARYQRANETLDARQRVFDDQSRSLAERMAAGAKLEAALAAALQVQNEYDRATNTESSRKAELRGAQTEYRSRMASLTEAYLTEQRNGISQAMEQLREQLVEADGRFQDPSSSAAERLEVGEGIVAALEAIARQCDEYERLSGEELEAEGGIRETVEGFSGWLTRSREALAEGCLREEGLSTSDLERLLAVPAPDATVAREIERCGVAFEPSDERMTLLVAAGLGEKARVALAAGEAARLARADLPRLDDIMDTAARALDNAPPVSVAAPTATPAQSPGLFDAGTKLYWSGLSQAQLDHFDAERFCQDRPTDWRLPTIEELESFGRGPKQALLRNQIVWSASVRSKTGAWAYDAAAAKKEGARRKFSLRYAVCVRTS